MPNYCDCDLILRGDASNISKFLEFVKGKETVLDFDRILRYPTEYAELDKRAHEWDEAQKLARKKKKRAESWDNRPKDGFNSGGYMWRILNWGTKWNAIDPYLRRRRKISKSVVQQKIKFYTAWSPPIPVIYAASSAFPKIEFELRFYECGSAIKGNYICKGGEVNKEECSQYTGTRGG